MPRMYHPQLDAYTDATEAQARNRRASGWVDAVDRPNVSDPKSDWVEWAKSQGVDNAEDMIKQELTDL